MMVKELIELLKEFPPEETVYTYDRDDQQEEITEVRMGHCWVGESDKLMVI